MAEGKWSQLINCYMYKEPEFCNYLYLADEDLQTTVLVYLLALPVYPTATGGAIDHVGEAAVYWTQGEVREYRATLTLYTL